MALPTATTKTIPGHLWREIMDGKHAIASTIVSTGSADSGDVTLFPAAANKRVVVLGVGLSANGGDCVWTLKGTSGSHDFRIDDGGTFPQMNGAPGPLYVTDDGVGLVVGKTVTSGSFSDITIWWTTIDNEA